MRNDSPCFRKSIQNAKLNSLTVNFAAGRSHDQLYKVCNLFALQHLCCRHKILKTSVGTGTDEHLVDGLALKLTDITNLVHLRRTCHYRHKILCLISYGLHVYSIRISHKTLLIIIKLYVAVSSCLLIRREKCTFRTGLNCHIRHSHTACHRHTFNGVSGKFQGTVSSSICTKVTDQAEDDILGHDILRKFSVDHNFYGFRNLDPHGSCSQDAGHLCVTDTRRKRTDTSISRCMAVCTKYNIARFNITCLSHKLMTDTVTSVYVFHAVFSCKSISHMEMSGIILLTCRYKMVIDQNNLVRIPQLLKAHLLKFFRYKRNKDIMDHHPVHIDRHDIARLYCLACIMSDNFFNDRLAHYFSPLRFLVQAV